MGVDVDEEAVRWLAALASVRFERIAPDPPKALPSGGTDVVDAGSVFVAGGGAFNDESAFHSREYLLETWGRSFGLRHFRRYNLNR